MEFRAQDLAEYGVVLVVPGAPGYDALRDEILQRVKNPVAGSPVLPEQVRPRVDDTPAAVLVNRSTTGIASIYQIWTIEEEAGRTYTSSIGGGMNSSVLLPFGINERSLKLYGYWHVILPGSKRLITIHGEIAGDNSDVRPPGPDEVWAGGGGIGFSGGRRPYKPLAAVTLALDGVFFADGAFAGPNRGHVWEQTVFTAEACVDSAKLARRLHDDGAAPARILDEVRAALGGGDVDTPPPPPRLGAWTPDRYREWARNGVWRRIAMSRRMGDDRAVYAILDWLDAPVPNFRKL